MTIDTERLKHDESLWPDEAVGCWVVTEDNGSFVKKLFVCHPGEGVVMNEEQRAKYIPRPTKPEWVDGLPPAGSQCECFHIGSNGKKEWTPCDVIGPYGDYVICAPNGGGFYGFDAAEVRPLKSDAERLREELAELIASHAVIPSHFQGEASNAARTILDKFNVTRK